MFSEKMKKKIICYRPQAGLNYKPSIYKTDTLPLSYKLLGANADDAFVEPFFFFFIILFFTKCVAPSGHIRFNLRGKIPNQEKKKLDLKGMKRYGSSVINLSCKETTQLVFIIVV